jgi:transketolase
VVCVSDANHLRGVLRASVDHPGAMYIRLGRGRDPQVYDDVPNIVFGRAIRLREGNDVAIITTGSVVHPSLRAADELAARGISTRVVDMHTISPIDVQEILAAADQCGAVVTVEEANRTGGLGSAVAEVLADHRRAIRFTRHGVPDEHVLIGPPAALYSHYRLDVPGIVDVVTNTLQGD